MYHGNPHPVTQTTPNDPNMTQKSNKSWELVYAIDECYKRLGTISKTLCGRGVLQGQMDLFLHRFTSCVLVLTPLNMSCCLEINS
jgi:hypothetical protein